MVRPVGRKVIDVGAITMATLCFRWLLKENGLGESQVTIVQGSGDEERDLAEFCAGEGDYALHSLHALGPRQGRLNGNSAFVENPASLGIKWNAEVPANVDEGLPNLTALLIMNDPRTGFPIAVIDGTWITAMRTGAASAISARHLAPRRVKAMALIGCGVQMRTQLIGVAAVLKPEVIQIFDLRPDAMHGFVKQMSPRVGIEIEVCATAQHAITDADLVVSATKFVISPEPTLKGDWVKPGALVMPIDVASVWDAQAYLMADKFITDRWDILKVVAESGHFPHGLPKLYAELHEIVTGKKPGRESDDELIVVRNEGMPIEDVTMGKLAYDRAVEAGVGTRLPFIATPT